jgi:hypothetical protein
MERAPAQPSRKDPRPTAADRTLPASSVVRWVMASVLVEAAALLTFYLRAH